MKTLIVYYSWSGHTRRVAERLHKEKGWDMAEIRTVRLYPDSYQAVVAEGKRQQEEHILPALEPLSKDLHQYDTIVLGTPVWWYTMAPAVRAFLKENHLAGKSLCPFATHEGDPGRTMKDIKNEAAGAAVHYGMTILFSGSRLMEEEEDIRRWADEIK